MPIPSTITTAAPTFRSRRRTSPISDPTKRPLGVWILTIADGIFAGLVPIGTIMILNLYPAARQAANTYAGVALAGLFLGASICLMAYRTWLGDDRARKVLLLLLTVHWGLIALDNAEMPALVLSTLGLALNYWYFHSQRPQAFFAASRPPS